MQLIKGKVCCNVKSHNPHCKSGDYWRDVDIMPLYDLIMESQIVSRAALSPIVVNFSPENTFYDGPRET